MRLHTDEQLLALTKSDLLDYYQKMKLKLPSDLSEDVLSETLKKYERTRTIGIWHDHSEILGHGYVLVTMKVYYDTAVFKTMDEIGANHQVGNIQAYVEEPEIHILGMASSSIDDQAALIGDRTTCIKQITTQFLTSQKITIKDKLMFFSADKPASQFERGTQIGGKYPCGSCGIHVLRMDDFTHCSLLKWRSLEELQSLVLKGRSIINY